MKSRTLRRARKALPPKLVVPADAGNVIAQPEMAVLYALGAVAPAGPKEAVEFLGLRLLKSPLLANFTLKQAQAAVERLEAAGLLVKVQAVSQPLYAMNEQGHLALGPLKDALDHERLALLKATRTGIKVEPSRRPGKMAGVSPSPSSSRDTQGTNSGLVFGLPLRRSALGKSENNPRFLPVAALRARDKQPRAGSFGRLLGLNKFRYHCFPNAELLNQAIRSNKKKSAWRGLAAMLGVSPGLLTRLMFGPAQGKYRAFKLKKASGGHRVIHSPRPHLKAVQHFLLDYCLHTLPVHPACHGFSPKRSILSNALVHRRQRYVLNMDIKDYFGSVHRERVAALLRANGFASQWAYLLARLVTFENALPQGAPTSPAIANSFLFEFDQRVAELSKQKRLRYTRYADDLTLSGRDHKALASLERQIGTLLKKSGLKVNEKKSRLISQGGRQEVTGVVVNQKVLPPRTLRRRIRAMFHQASLDPEAFKARKAQLSGYLAYLRSFPQLRNRVEMKGYGGVLEEL